MSRRLITLVSTKGKTPEEMHKELSANLEKYHKTKPHSTPKPPLHIEEVLKSPNVVYDPQPINTATQITGYPQAPKPKPRRDKTSLLIALGLVASIIFAWVTISWRNRIEQAKNPPLEPCWTTKYENGTFVDVKSSDPTCPDDPNQTPIGR